MSDNEGLALGYGIRPRQGRLGWVASQGVCAGLSLIKTTASSLNGLQSARAAPPLARRFQAEQHLPSQHPLGDNSLQSQMSQTHRYSCSFFAHFAHLVVQLLFPGSMFTGLDHPRSKSFEIAGIKHGDVLLAGPLCFPHWLKERVRTSWKS